MFDSILYAFYQNMPLNLLIFGVCKSYNRFRDANFRLTYCCKLHCDDQNIWPIKLLETQNVNKWCF